jgi:ATP-binding cassette subfamily B protein
LRGERGALTAATGLAVLAVLVDLARPWPLALALDYAVVGHPWLGMSPTAMLVGAGVGVVAITALGGLTDYAATSAGERSAERAGARLRQDVADRVLRLELPWHDRTPSGEILSRLTTDVGRLLDALVAVTAVVLADAVRLALVLVILFALSPALALIALAIVPLLAGFAVRQRRRVRAAQLASRSAAGRFAAVATDVVRNVRAVQAFARFSAASRAVAEPNGRLLTANLNAVRVEARWAPVADSLLAIGTGLVLIVGGRLVLDGQLSVGDLVVVTSYVSALYSPVRSLSRLSGVLAKATVSSQRLAEILSADPSRDDPSRDHARPVPGHVGAPVDPASAAPGIEFERVRFGYRPDRPVLTDFTLTVRGGRTTCLFGPSGAGKSTLLHLLLRLYEIDAGTIRLGGTDTRTLDVDVLRRQVALVPQDPWLLDATIAQNIAFGAPGVGRLQTVDAARIALVDEFVRRLPDGYDTQVGENGVRLSGGQRRRVALARAVATRAPVLVLDEPTASLDHASAEAVTAALTELGRRCTVLIVSHDPRLADIADDVVVLGAHDLERADRSLAHAR